jgi:hypothetical protein
MRAMTTGEVCLEAGRAERFTATAQSLDGFDRLPCPASDPTLPRMLEGVIMTSQPPGIRRMSAYIREAWKLLRLENAPAPVRKLDPLEELVQRDGVEIRPEDRRPKTP